MIKPVKYLRSIESLYHIIEDKRKKKREKDKKMTERSIERGLVVRGKRESHR